LAEKLSRLPDEQREVVVARIWGDLSFEEIARVLEKSQATVWRQYQAALMSLRELYGATCETKK
jgi:RNA polymerase sigma-70 factor (ECF subfamily)